MGLVAREASNALELGCRLLFHLVEIGLPAVELALIALELVLAAVEGVVPLVEGLLALDETVFKRMDLVLALLLLIEGSLAHLHDLLFGFDQGLALRALGCALGIGSDLLCLGAGIAELLLCLGLCIIDLSACFLHLRAALPCHGEIADEGTHRQTCNRN